MKGILKLLTSAGSSQTSAAKQRVLWAFTEARQLRVSLGKLCGSQGIPPYAKGEVSAAAFNLVSSKPSEWFPKHRQFA